MISLSGQRVGSGRRRLHADSWAVTLAVAAFVGAMHPLPVPVWVAASALVATMVVARPLPLILGVTMLSCSLASQAVAGSHPLPQGQFNGIVQLATDPTVEHGRVTAEVRTEMGRLQLSAESSMARALVSGAAGDRFVADGGIRELRFAMPWRHLRGVLEVRSISSALDPTPAVAFVNKVRSVIATGARVLPSALRPIQLGFVIGDDRGTSPVVRYDFEKAGLAHLMVVSGENLGFLLILARPVLRGAGLRRRFMYCAALLMVFMAITRFEPSVLRASAMAAVLAITILSGRPASSLRVLSLAVVGVVLLDPLIVHSIGFRLSVAATAGIVLLARRLAGILPLPRSVGLALAVPVSAQIGVAPIALFLFGPPSLLAIPANVAAAPAAAFIMMWGSTVGVLAGFVPDLPASLLFWPDRIALEWVTGVASVAAENRIGPFVGAAAVALVVMIGIRAIRRRSERWMLLLFALVVFLPLVVQARTLIGAGEAGCFDVARARICQSSGGDHLVVASVGGDADVTALLSRLDSRGIDRIDLLIRTSSSASARRAIAELSERLDVRRLVSFEDISGTERASAQSLRVGTIAVTIRPSRDRLEVSMIDGFDGPR